MAPSHTGGGGGRSVALWEKEFCVNFGLFRWEEFVRAKKRVYHHHNVMAWDDSASQEAFNNAKETFKARYFGGGVAAAAACPSPIMHHHMINDSSNELHATNVDEFVDWFAETDPDLLRGVGTCPKDLAILGDDCEDAYENVICHCKADNIVDDHDTRINEDDEPLLMWEKSTCKCCCSTVLKDLWKIKDDGTLIGEKGLARLEYQKEEGGHGRGEIYNIRFSPKRRNKWFQQIVDKFSCSRRRYKY